MKKQLLKSLFGFVISFFVVTRCFAFDVKVDGIYYNLNTSDNTAGVTSGDVPYKGIVVIPESFISEGIKYKVTEICDFAFKVMDKYTMDSYITSVTIPNSVSRIGNGAFYDCYTLTSVTLSEGITNIGEEAFHNCGFETIHIPNSVKTIGNGAFGSSQLTTVEIPNSVTDIGWLFGDCIHLKSATLPDGITTIPAGMFAGCDSLEAITIPNGVKTIESIAFSYCHHLTSIELPNSVVSIENEAFSHCRALKHINLSNVESIGWRAFESCVSLKTVTIPQGVKTIEHEAFAYTNIETLYYNAEDCICSSKNGPYYSPFHWVGNLVIGNGVVNIPDFAFSEVCGFKKVDIPNSVKRIGDYAFIHGTIESLNIPESVTEIGHGAFMNTSVVSIDIPASITTISDEVFAECSQLVSVDIPNGVTSIGINAFLRCKGLKEIAIPNSVTSIGDGAFGECVDLTEVVVPNSVTSIGYAAFGECTNLTKINIPNQVKVLEGTFMGCTGLTEIEIPNSVTTLNKSFEGCTGLTEMEIPNSVTTLRAAFNGCSSLKKINIPNSVTALEGLSGTFEGCSGLTEINLPDNLTSIGSFTFYGCSGLTKINIPNSVTEIGYNAFEGCTGLTEMIIPQKVESIEFETFLGCSGLRKIVIPENVSFITANAFYVPEGDNLQQVFSLREEVPESFDDIFRKGLSTTLYVPLNSEDTYRANWGKYFSTIKSLVVIGEENCTAYSNVYGYDFSNITGLYERENKLKTYTVTGYDAMTGKVVLSETATVSAGTAALLVGPEDYYPLENNVDTNAKPAGTRASNGKNYLKEVLTETTVQQMENGNYNYYLTGGVFRLINGAQVISANSAYLSMPAELTNGAEILGIEGVTPTGISNISSCPNTVVEDFYDMQGRHLDGMRKGFNIVRYKDGSVRKVVVK